MSRSFIKKQLLLPLSLAFLFVLLAAVACIYWLQVRHIERAVDNRLTGVEHLIPKLLAKEAEALEVLLDLLVQDRELQQVWLSGDREKIYRQTVPLFENIRSRYGVSHFYFIQPNRYCFLRVHNPPAYGDFIDRFTMEEAARTGDVVVGAELGKFEAFTLRVVKPWYIDGHLAGYIELGQEIVNLTQVLQKILGVDLVLTLSKSLLHRQEWEEGRKLFNRSANWDDFPSFVVADQTFGRIPPALIDILRYSKKLTDDQKLAFKGDGEGEYQGRIAPLHDAGGRRIGQIMVLHEISREVQYLNKAVFIIAVLTTAAGGVLYVLFNLFAGKIDRTLNRSFAALEHEIAERQQTQEELQTYQAQLYELVEDRTAQLKQANDLLQQDILRRQQIEGALRESEQKFRYLFDCANENIFIIDPESLRLLEANRTASQRLGYTPDELKRLAISDLYPPGEAELAGEHIRKIMDKNYFVFEHVQVTREGREIPVEVSSQVIEYESRKAILFFVREISDRKEAEAERQRAQRLESIGLLAGGIAHDFNNILTAILGNITLAMVYLKPGSKAVTKLLMAEKASMRARSLAQQLLTFAKGGAPVKKVLPLPQLLQEPVLLALRGSIIKSEFELQENLWPVEVDEGQFSQVISNLVINAVQAMPAGGLIKITAVNQTIEGDNHSGLAEGKYVRIEINDQGTGIPEKYLDKIFDPYFTTKKTGSGLGLAICYSIIKKHGGMITVDSTAGTGSTFSLFLPAAEGEPAAEVDKKEEIQHGTGRILVMDDDEFVNQVAADLLRHLGYHPETVTGGAEAIAAYRLAMAKGEPFDAVITDLTVPGNMGGEETARQLLEIDSKARVIVSSGYANDPIMADYARYGFKGVIPKPYKTAELSRTLQEVLKKRTVE